mgnify:CR=1 FL=1
MTDVISVREDDTVLTAIGIMDRHNVGALPVLDSHGCIVGACVLMCAASTFMSCFAARRRVLW